MYRIEKRVSRILKVKQPHVGIGGITNNDLARHGLTWDDVDTWMQSVWQDFITDPIVDEIAGRFNMDGDDALDAIEILDFYVTTGEAAHGVGGATNEDKPLLRLRVPLSQVEEDYRTDALGVLGHEFTHVVDNLAGTLGTKPPVLTMRAWIGHESEREAIGSNMLDLIRFGYSKSEVIEILVARYDSRLRHQPASDTRYFIGELEKIYDEVTLEMEEEYVEA